MAPQSPAPPPDGASAKVVVKSTSKDSSEAIKERFRETFNRKIFNITNNGLTIDGKEPSRLERSFQMTQKQWDENVDLLTKWYSNDEAERFHTRRKFKDNGYRLARTFSVETVTLPSGDTCQKLYKGHRLAIPQLEVFDAIYDAHAGVAHLKRTPTWYAVKRAYYNVSQDQVQTFCNLCPVCIGENPTARRQVGAKKPILSSEFRDRFQVDLVDFRKKAQTNVFGVTMRWLVVLKDHHTKLCAIDCIPRKRPKFVAHVLGWLFGMLGYPSIFHTDNGNEFTAKQIMFLLKDINPNITTVTGRPRCPNDQGSVENINKMVKRVISNIEEEERQRGRQPNWTMLLGRVMSAINQQKQKGTYAVSAYEAWTGMEYHAPIPVPHEHLRQCTTVDERLKLYNDPRLEKVARELYILSDEKKEYRFD